MDQGDLKRLREAVEVLENPGWTARITNMIGMPLEWAVKKLPKGASEIISKATDRAIKRAFVVSISTMNPRYHGKPFKWAHKIAVIASGGVGGFFGLPGLIFELPISTAIMLRSIADIARSEGENLKDPEAELACIEVFALGSQRRIEGASETSYYAVRIALARTLTEASQFITEKGFVEEGSPVIMRFIARIASRFGIIVSEKTAAEAVPIIGAVGGASINLAFINHFQSMAHGHFIVRSLERKWGKDSVKSEYDKMAGNWIH